MNNQYDILENLKEIDSKASVIITSYNYDQDFFEKQILPHFHSSSYPLILIDNGEYQENISKFQQSRLAGRKYFVDSISCLKTFHPKVFCAISENQTFILIGSNNLTWAGYTLNAEIITPIIINYNNPERPYLLKDFKKFLSNLLGLMDSQIYSEDLKGIINKIPELKEETLRDSWLLNSIDSKPLLDQILEIINEPITKINVISPYFAQDKEFYKKIYGICSDIHIFIQQNYSNLPVEILREFNEFTYHLIESERFIHAKILFIETNSINYIFSGSANFSSSALVNNANVEIGILTKGKMSFKQILKGVGDSQDIALDEILTFSIENENKSTGLANIKIIDAIYKEDQLAITLDNLNSSYKFTIYLNGEEYELPYHIDGNTLLFDLEKELFSLFTGSVTVSLVGRNDERSEESLVRLIYNKKLFPLELDLLNYRSINDANWLFAILRKLAMLRDPTPYFTALKGIVDSDILISNGREEAISEFRFNTDAYNPELVLKNIIDSCIHRHDNRIKKINGALNVDQFRTQVNSLLLTNKLIIWSIVHENREYNELYLIKNNLAEFFKKDGHIFRNVDLEIYVNCSSDSSLKYHLAVVTYVLDYLQLKSGKYEPNIRFGFNHIKRAFETSTVDALNTAIEYDDNIFYNSELSRIFNEYIEIVPTLREISIKYLNIRLNEIIEIISIDQSKRYPILEFR